MDNHHINIGNKIIGNGHPCFILAEIAQAHDGSLGVAHSYIDAVADAGADGIKFQTHFADEESTLDEKFRVNFSYEDATRYAYWKRMEFTDDQLQGLFDHARERNLVFLSSAFSVKAVALLSNIGVPAWKIASGEIENEILWSSILATNKPILLSSGMSSWNEIDAAVKVLSATGNPYAIFQCTSMYPTPLGSVGLNMIGELGSKYKVPVGLSDHSGSVIPAISAMTLGASILEVHATFHKQIFGPDSIASLTIEELKYVVEARDAIQTMLSNPVDKDAMAKKLSSTKQLFSRSVALKKDAIAGTIIDAKMLTLKKPGSGISPENMSDIIGKKLRQDCSAARLLTHDDLMD